MLRQLLIKLRQTARCVELRSLCLGVFAFVFNSLKALQELNTKTQRRQDTKNTEKKDWFLGKIGGWHRFFGEKFGVVQKPRNLSLESLSSYSLLYFGGFS